MTDRKAPRVQFTQEGVSRTKQAHQDECNVNRIMARFERTGIIDHFNRFEGMYDDFTNVPQSYHEAIEQVMRAEEMFMSLPSRLRARFENDAGQFLAFIDNPSNADELVELGLVHPKDAPIAAASSRRKQTAAAGADTPASSNAASPPDGGSAA